jgi:hypothetical protein
VIGRLLGVALLAAVLTGPALRPAEAGKKRSAKRYDKTEKKVAGGTSWRIKSPKGAVYVWIPDNYERESAGMVVYIHGYGVDVDEAWKSHRLPQQFHTSRQNAMFIVPEAPQSNQEGVTWDALSDLKRAVRHAGIRLPDGPSIVIGHSGAFRTIAKWLDNKLLAEVILLDALYARQAEFEQFIDSGKRAGNHKLIIVAAGTVGNARAFAKKFRYAAVRENIPDTYAKLSKREKRSKLLYLRSQYGHSDIVRGGKVIPLVLRLTPLKLL